MTSDELDRIAALEARVATLEDELLRQQSLTRSPVQPPPPLGPRADSPAGPRRERPRIESEDLLKWGGITLVVLAIAFAVSTAISRGWIGPELQLVGALGVSVGLAVAGLRLRATRPRWVHALCSGGALGPFLIGASDLFVDLTSERAGLVVVAAATVTGYALAGAARSSWVGGVTMLASTIAPLTLGLGDEPTIAVAAWGASSYVVALGLGLLRPLPGLHAFAHPVVMAWLVGTAAMAEAQSSDVVVTLLAIGVAGALHLTPSIGDRSSGISQMLMRSAALATPWLLLVLTILHDPDSNRLATIAVGLAAATAVASLALGRHIDLTHLVALLVGASVTLSIGLAVLFETSPTALALAVQGLGLLIAARTIDSGRWLFANGLVLIATAAVIAAVAMIDAWEVDASLAVDTVHLGVVACLAAAAVAVRQTHLSFALAGTALSAAMLWLGSVLVHLPQGQALVSLAWAVVGVAVLIIGTRTRQTEVGYAGLTVLAITVVKLLSVDLGAVDALWRAALFMAIGLGFLRLGFVLPSLIQGDTPPPDAPES